MRVAAVGAGEAGRVVLPFFPLYWSDACPLPLTSFLFGKGWCASHWNAYSITWNGFVYGRKVAFYVNVIFIGYMEKIV